MEETIVYVNPSFERISGYSQAEVLGKTPVCSKAANTIKPFIRSCGRPSAPVRSGMGRFVNKKKDGPLCTLEATINPVRDELGSIVNYVSVRRDITADLQREEQYRQAQRMEVVGRLAGGVAHDFNNLLTIITGYTDFLEQSHPDEEDPTRKDIEHIKKAAEGATELVRQLLAFSRKQILEPKVVDLNSIVIHTEKMLSRLIGEDVHLTTSLDQALGRVKADPGQLEQVILNLAVNARDAMPYGGTLTIETSNISLDEALTRQYPDLASGPHVLLAMSDTGLGMDADTQAHLFEPFFTTREVGKGTGLGLAIVYGITFILPVCQKIELLVLQRSGLRYAACPLFPAPELSRCSGHRQWPPPGSIRLCCRQSGAGPAPLRWHTPAGGKQVGARRSILQFCLRIMGTKVRHK